MKPDEVDFVCEIARIGAGLLVDRDKVYLIESRLGPVARREGFGSIREMLITARQKREESLTWAVVEAMTGGETCFFRDPAVFKTFRDDILPRLAKQSAGQPIRIWSAGCSTGQEAYSLALSVADSNHLAPNGGVEIVGSDLSEQGLEKARSGIYTQFEVQRGLPIQLLVEHFEKRDELWALSAAIRSMVQWKRVNLNSDFRSQGQFDVIFCRNVLEAMDERAQAAALTQLASSLAPNGYLVLGANETPSVLPEAFIPLNSGIFQPNPEFRFAA